MKNRFLIVMGLFTGFAVQAQKNIPQANSYILSGKFQDWQKAPGGMLLVGTNEGFSGIDGHKPGVQYTYTEMGKIKPEEMEILQGFPWALLHQTEIKYLAKAKKVIVDYITGKPVIETHKIGWKRVDGSKFIPEKGQVIFWGQHEKSNFAMAAYDVQSNNEIAFIDLSKKVGAGIVGAKDVRIEDDKIFVLGSKMAFCINLDDYAILWTNDKLTNSYYEPHFFWDNETQSTYIYQSFLKGKVYRINNATGEMVWKKPISIDGAVQEIKKINGGLWIYAVETKSFTINIYEPETGLPRWKKSFEEDGDVEAQIFTDNTYIYGSTRGEVNTLDFNGNKVLKKPIKTGEGFNAFALNKNGNLFYLTQNTMGIANLQDGSFVKAPTKFKKIDLMTTAYDKKNERFVVSTGTEAYFIDKEGNTNKIAEFKFQGAEYPNKIEFRDGGILLTADQNAMLLDYDGKTKYNVYFKAPSKSAFGAIMAAGAAAASMSMAMNQAARAGALQGITKPGMKTWAQDRAEKDAKNFGGNATSALNELNKRFSATQATKDFIYIQTKLDEGVGMVKINKDSGTKLAEIVLKDKKPEYLIDEDFGIFYYKKADKEIVDFDLR